MITVSNTTAITTLLKVGRSDLLNGLFGQVWIPTAVEQELLAFHASMPAGCAVHSVPDSHRPRRLLTQADRGEAEAICLAVEAGADLLPIDDKKGWRLAEAEVSAAWGCPRWFWARTGAAWFRPLPHFSIRWSGKATTVCRPGPMPSCFAWPSNEEFGFPSPRRARRTRRGTGG